MRYLYTDSPAVGGTTGGEYGFKVEDKKDLTIRNKLNDLGNGRDFIVKNDGQNYIVTPESDEARSALKTYVNSLKEQGFNVVHEDINGSFNIAKKDVPNFVSLPAKSSPEKMISLRNDNKIIADKIITERDRLNLIAVASAVTSAFAAADSPLESVEEALSAARVLSKSSRDNLILTTEQKKQYGENVAKARDIIAKLGLEDDIKIDDLFSGLKNEKGEPLVMLQGNSIVSDEVKNVLREAGIPFGTWPALDQLEP
ncbi:MAG: hypothetical protein LBK68_01405 [Candidatus Margulisbacteria bacterium]|jgi:hypothetical protein|nr:hypothetical protein [Candidatus Margulisiibacteriota bacterium]